MLTNASKAASRARPVRSRPVVHSRDHIVAGPSRWQQARGFRFSLWYILTDELRRDAYQRKRVLERKFSKNFGGHFPWAKKYPFLETWHESMDRLHPRPKVRSCSHAKPKKQQSSPNPEGVRPGQNIEDVERGAMDHLIFGHESKPLPSNPKSEIKKTKTTKSNIHTNYARPVEHEDFIIDPITNRKISKSPTSSSSSSSPKYDGNIPVKTWKGDFARNHTGEPSASQNSDGKSLPHGNSPRHSPLKSAGLDMLGNEQGVPRRDQLKAALQRAHEQFDGLKPQSGLATLQNDVWSGSSWTEKTMLNEIQAGIKAGLRNHHDPYVSGSRADDRSPTSVVASPEKSVDGQKHALSQAASKSSGFVENHSPSDNLFRAGPSFERLESVDFPPSMAQDLRDKFKQYTAVRDVNDTKKMPSATEQNKKQQGVENILTMDKKTTPSSTAPVQKLGGILQAEHEIPQNPSPVQHAKGKQSNYREMLDSLMEQHVRLSDAADIEASRAIKSASSKMQQSTTQTTMSGNYVRDFPEEFKKSWTETLAAIPPGTKEACENEINFQSENMDGGLEGAFGQPTPSRLQPALDRQQPAKESAIFKRSALSKAEDLDSSRYAQTVNGTQSLPTKQSPESASSIRASGSPSKESTKPSSSGDFRSMEYPKLYKILAYDPTMQKVNIAETTSLVPDFASALTPADALLRLSHPMKFFPHFAALEAEGFEIVSGSGDVLIFRKARPSCNSQAEESHAESKAEPERRYTTTPINPIDMTGRPKIMSPASANFASPTGYVTYENLPENEASNLPPPPPPPPQPRVKYNINVRREEPVYSGPKEQPHDRQKKKIGLGKRMLLGGVWVAGISYGLGVITEYFTTGGLDGRGPHGF